MIAKISTMLFLFYSLLHCSISERIHFGIGYNFYYDLSDCLEINNSHMPSVNVSFTPYPNTVELICNIGTIFDNYNFKNLTDSFSYYSYYYENDSMRLVRSNYRRNTQYQEYFINFNSRIFYKNAFIDLGIEFIHLFSEYDRSGTKRYYTFSDIQRIYLQDRIEPYSSIDNIYHVYNYSLYGIGYKYRRFVLRLSGRGMRYVGLGLSCQIK